MSVRNRIGRFMIAERNSIVTKEKFTTGKRKDLQAEARKKTFLELTTVILDSMKIRFKMWLFLSLLNSVNMRMLS